jgi:hypothetical protein
MSVFPLLLTNQLRVLAGTPPLDAYEIYTVEAAEAAGTKTADDAFTEAIVQCAQGIGSLLGACWLWLVNFNFQGN